MKEIKLSIDGKDYNFSLGLGFFGEVTEYTGIGIEDIYPEVEKNPMKWIPLLMYCSAKYSCYLDNIEPDFTLRELVAAIHNEEDGINSVKTTSFMVALNKSMTKDVPVEKGDSQEPKKK